MELLEQQCADRIHLVVAAAIRFGSTEGTVYALAAISPSEERAQSVLQILHGMRDDAAASAALEEIVSGEGEALIGVLAYTRVLGLIHASPAAAAVLRREGDSGRFRPAAPTLTELILRRPEAAEAIAQIAIERRTSDGALIEELLDDEAAPLRPGML